MIFSTFRQPYWVELGVLLGGFVDRFKGECKTRQDKSLVEISTRNTFRLMEQWMYDFSYVGRHGEDGIDEEEAKEVYDFLDEAFKESFPSHCDLARPAMAEYVEKIICAVHSEMVEGRIEMPGARQDLIRFLEVVVLKLRPGL